MSLGDKIRARRLDLKMTQQELADRVGYNSRSAINKIERGFRDINQSQIADFAKALDTTPAYLMGIEQTLYSPKVTEAFVTYPVIGDIAAGYDKLADSNWTGETVDIPLSYLKGRAREDFFVLRVKGNSMYPLYHDGDRVLILKQATLNRSGEIGAVLYDDEIASLKKVEYVNGEDWMLLIPINPEFAPEKIEGERLCHCRIMGIPRLLIREME